MEETTPHCDCGLIAGPWANGGAPLAGGRGMAMDRFTIQAARSLPAQILRSWRTGESGNAGTPGVLRHRDGHDVRRVRDSRFPSTHSDGEGCRQRRGHSVCPHRLSTREEASGGFRRETSLNAMCLPRLARHYTSLLYLSLTRCCAVSHTGRLGPHSTPSELITFAPHRGNPGVGAPDGIFRFGEPAQGVLGLGSQFSP